MKNNRGDIPITILVIGVFAVCTLAILSFIASSISLRNSFVGIDFIEEVNLEIEKSQFNEKEINSFYLEKNKTRLPIDWRKDELLFSVEYKKP